MIDREPTLVIMAAGMGSRFGGLKQMTPVDPEGHFIIDFSLCDAHRAGFRVCGVAERAYARGEGALRAASDWFIEASFDELREKLQYFG